MKYYIVDRVFTINSLGGKNRGKLFNPDMNCLRNQIIQEISEPELEVSRLIPRQMGIHAGGALGPDVGCQCAVGMWKASITAVDEQSA